MKGDALGDRMKDYERATRDVLPPHTYTVLRVDGRAFHAYLRHAAKPFDIEFVRDMAAVSADLCREVDGTLLAYGQSDEISLIASDLAAQAQPWFGGVVQKMASVAAAVATGSLVARRGYGGAPHFDGRVFTLPSLVEVENYLIWRQRDAVRNSIASAAQAHYSHRELHGVNVREMVDMLRRDHGIAWADYPAEVRNGWAVRRAERLGDVVYTDRRTGEQHTIVASRSVWESGPAPTFEVGRLLPWLESVRGKHA